jgi:hypothetical protein
MLGMSATATEEQPVRVPDDFFLFQATNHTEVRIKTFTDRFCDRFLA